MAQTIQTQMDNNLGKTKIFVYASAEKYAELEEIFRRNTQMCPLLPDRTRLQDSQLLLETIERCFASEASTKILVLGDHPQMMCQLAAKYPNLRTILIISSQTDANHLNFPDMGRVGVIVPWELAQSLNPFLTEICCNLLGEANWGVERFFGQQAQIHRFTLSGSGQRLWFRETLVAFVRGLSPQIGRSLDSWANIAGEVQEELLMNAIWDSNPERAKTDRKVPVQLRPEEYVKVEWIFEPPFLGISVQDSFGSFKPKKIEEYQTFLYKPVKPDPIKVSTVGRGAGIGLYMILHRMSAFLVTLEPQKRTEVIVLFKLDDVVRKISKKSKSYGKIILS